MPLGDTTYIEQDPKVYNDNNELTKLKGYVLRQLGWPLIRVEMTDDQLVDCILDAVQLYQEYAAIDYDLRVVTPSANIVTIPDDINPKFIVDVIFYRDYMDSLASGFGTGGYEEALGGVLPFDQSGRSPIVTKFNIAEYYMYVQHMEDFKKIVGIKRTFRIINDQIHLYPATQAWNEVGILYKPMISEETAEQSQWIKQYSTARAKKIVGIIRSKLSGFSSTGINIAADGESMKAEAQAEIDKLEEGLKNGLGMPMPLIQM